MFMIYKNNKKYLFYFSNLDSEYIEFSIKEMKLDNPKIRTLRLPIYVIKKYFPFSSEGDGLKTLFNLYGTHIVEGYMHCFEDYPFSFINKNFFNVTIFCTKT